MANTVEVTVPDIGDFDGVEIIEVLVSAGDTISAEDSLITLESDKASMEIPSPHGGRIKELKVKLGDRVSQGDAILLIDLEEGAGAAAANEPEVHAQEPQAPTEPPPAAESPAAAATAPEPQAPAPAPVPGLPQQRPSPTAHLQGEGRRPAHASPSVRRFARELGADLHAIDGSGPKGRILKSDVQAFVKRALTQPAGGLGVAPAPEIDFAAFGEVELQALTKINKLTGQALHRSWVTVPHVTQFDEVDITELDSFRKRLAEEYKPKGVKITFLAFLLKAVVSALREYPRFNASLDATQENLILKRYFHIGVAVDTPQGLVVPVLRDVDRKSLVDLAEELQDLSLRARERKLRPAEMQGGCFTISSLGGIGGTSFTPIVNAPEVAILGVSRARMQPVWTGEAFEPRLVMPYALSYDHRVIDGAAGARFTSFLGSLLSDMRRMLL
jgi:pyruvate dehydrogenase E2 component (dihydrolipoamide acetyltransferase)